MNRQLMLLLIMTVVLAILFVAGCGTPAAEPVAESPPATATPVPAAATPTPVPPAPTSPPTPIPPTPAPQPTSLASAPDLPWLLSSVWGSSASDVFAVAFPGAILHYDGKAWAPMNNGKPYTLAVVWGNSGSDVFATGPSGLILHYDGSQWSPMDSGTSVAITGVWGSSTTDVFAVGEIGTILHYDGSAWSPMDSGTTMNLNTAWGSSASDVFAVGTGGLILHYDGSQWSPMESGTTENLWGLWGSSGSDVFATGEGGTILHYDGSQWSPMESGTTTDLWVGVWGSSDNDVFAMGDKGTILHYDGSEWSPMTSGTTYSLESVWGSSGSDVFTVGHSSTILHYDGSSWSDLSSGATATEPVAEAPEARGSALDSAMVSKIETAIYETMKRNQLPGLAIGIIKDGQVVYTNGFGLAEVDTDRLVTPETVFRLGSVSKLMVGIALMQLKEQGKIDLDAPVTTYLPYFQLASEPKNDITIRQLLSHRSGLTLTTSHLEDFMSPEYDEGSLERHVRDLAHLKLGYLPPGTRMQYSDIGFEVLGDVIAKVSGQSFEAYTQEHIFTPLGMKHTTFLVQEVPPELLATPHEFGGSKARVLGFFPYSRKHAPSSHLFSSVDDMSRYALAQLAQGRGEGMAILPAAAYEEMWTAQGETNLPSSWRKDVGLGWFLGNHEGHRLVGHGEMERKGFGCGFIMAPDDGLAVIVMTNRDYLVENFSYQVMEWLLEAETKS